MMSPTVWLVTLSFNILKCSVPPHSLLKLTYILIMNSLIESLHGRDAFNDVKSFENFHEKMVRIIANLEFSKK